MPSCIDTVELVIGHEGEPIGEGADQYSHFQRMNWEDATVVRWEYIRKFNDDGWTTTTIGGFDFGTYDITGNEGMVIRTTTEDAGGGDVVVRLYYDGVELESIVFTTSLYQWGHYESQEQQAALTSPYRSGLDYLKLEGSNAYIWDWNSVDELDDFIINYFSGSFSVTASHRYCEGSCNIAIDWHCPELSIEVLNEELTVHSASVILKDMINPCTYTQIGDQWYRCILKHTPIAERKPGEGTEWETFWKAAGRPAGRPGVFYPGRNETVDWSVE